MAFFIFKSKYTVMKFTCKIDVDRSLKEVAALWRNQTYFDKWQEGFQSIEPVDGEPGEVGSISIIRFKTGKREMMLTETILENNKLHSFKGLYEHKHMVNTMHTVFNAIADQKTQVEVTVEYTQFNGFLPKILSTFFPGMFKKQVEKWLLRFKIFAESKLTDT